MKFSVAMTTYNGTRFLGEQLDSIFAQTRLPDEIVVCDDASTDTTLELLRGYVARSPCALKVFANERRLGSTKNFEKAISLCSGDLIALCDQDDVWRPEKLAVIERAFDDDPSLGVVLTNADLIDEDGTLLRRDLWARCRLNRRRQQFLRSRRRYDVLFGLPFTTGATMAFRSHFRSLVLPIPEIPTFIHDRWIAVLVAAVARIALIPEKLVAYRLHRRQQLGVGRLPFPLRVFVPHKCRSDALALAAFGERLGNTLCEASAEFPRALDDRRRHIEARCNLSRNPLRRSAQVASEFRSGRYTLYPYGWAVSVQDLLVGTR